MIDYEGTIIIKLRVKRDTSALNSEYAVEQLCDSIEGEFSEEGDVLDIEVEHIEQCGPDYMSDAHYHKENK